MQTELTVKINKLAAIIATWAVFGRYIEPSNETDLNAHVDAAYALGYAPIYAAADDWNDLLKWQERTNEVIQMSGDETEVIGMAVAKFISDYHGIIGLEEGRKNSNREAKAEAAKDIDYCPKHGSHHGNANDEPATGDDIVPAQLREALEGMGAKVKIVKLDSLEDLEGSDLPQDVKDAIRSQIEDLHKQPGTIN